MTYIHHIETLVPKWSYSQRELCERMLERSSNERSKRFIKKAYAESGIETRHSVLSDFQEESAEPRLFRNPDGSMKYSSTGERNAVYVEEAKQLIPQIALSTLAN